MDRFIQYTFSSRFLLRSAITQCWRPLPSGMQSFTTLMNASISGDRTPSNIASTPTRESNPYFGPVAGSGVIKALSPVDEMQYPSVKKSTEMVDASFQEVHPCLPVLLEHEFRRDFRGLMEARAKGDLSWGGGVSHSCEVKQSPHSLCV